MEILAFIKNNISILIALLALIVSIYSMRTQRRHNINSVLPICNISLSDINYQFSINIGNYGNGPMTIKQIKCENEKNSTENILDIISPSYEDNQAKLYYLYSTTNLTNRTIPSNSDIMYVGVSQTMDLQNKNEALHHETKKELRNAVSNLTITVYYSDIYENLYISTSSIVYPDPDAINAPFNETSTVKKLSPFEKKKFFQTL